MKQLFLVLAVLFLHLSAFAQSSTEIKIDSAPADSVNVQVLDDEELDNTKDNFYREGRFLVELNSRVNGSITGTYKTREQNESYSDSWQNGLSIALSGRYFVSEDQALTVSLPITEINNWSQNYNSSNFNVVHVAPVLFGYRYQFSRVGKSYLFRPFAQLESGLVLYAVQNYQSVPGAEGPEVQRGYDDGNTQSAFGLKPSVGMDIFAGRDTSYYFGVQAGYLFVKNYGASEFSINVGHMF